MGLLVLVVMLLELLWGRASLVVFAVFFDTGMPSTATVLDAVFNPRNWEFLAVYMVVGGAFAALVFCSMEIVPAWSALHLGWPAATYYLIMGGCGMTAGLLLATEYRLPAMFGGLAAGLGSLFANAFFMERATVTSNLVMVVLAAVGCIPGFLVYGGLRVLQDVIVPPPEKTIRPRRRLPDAHDDDEDDPDQRRCRRPPGSPRRHSRSRTRPPRRPGSRTSR